MATKIRLVRVGRRNLCAFRIVAIDSRCASNSGKCLEKIGSFDPKSDNIIINKDLIKKWINNGAIITGAVKGLLRKKKINLAELMS